MVRIHTIILFFVQFSFSTVIYIPDNYPTIQSGINVSSNGDSIIVSSGTYYENINYNGKSISIIGENRLNTIIDGGQLGSVVTFEDIENHSSLINFTIQNGNTTFGGGINCLNSNPFLTNLTIQNNLSTDGGGGVYCNDSSPVMEDISIHSNISNDMGGGIYLTNYSDPYGTNIIIDNNLSIFSGGGLYIVDNSDPYFDHITVTSNTTDIWGGGMTGKYGVNIKISNSIFWNNNPHEIAINEVTNSVFLGEYYSSPGTGSSPNFGELILTREDELINFNWSNGSPDPSIPNDDYQVRWTGNIFINVSGDYSFRTLTDDGVRLYIGGQIIIDHWQDQAPNNQYATINLSSGLYECVMEYYENNGGAVAELYWTPPGENESLVQPVSGSENGNTLIITHSDISGGSDLIQTGTSDELYFSRTNIDIDPSFSDESLFSLNMDSPCIDKGIQDTLLLFNNDQDTILIPPYDYDGYNPDMGAYEFVCEFPASYDDCNVCSGGNTGIVPNSDLDDCGICYGNNENQDCAGVCFGEAYIDECDICDDNESNDNQCYSNIEIVDTSLLSGSQGSVFVHLNNPEEIVGFQLEILDSPDLLHTVEVLTTDRTSSFNVYANEDENILYIVGFDLELDPIVPGTGPILEIVFNVDNVLEEQNVLLDIYNIMLVNNEEEELTFFETDGIINITLDVLLGDINYDELINILDVVSFVQLILSGEEFTSDQYLVCDMNGDGSLNIIDIVILVSFILGS